jgi:lipopolysaccharide assembly protein A
MNFRSVSILSLLAIFIIVSIQNVEVIPVHFLFWKAEISKLLLLIITLVIGILVGMIIPGFFSKSKKEEQIKVK